MSKTQIVMPYIGRVLSKNYYKFPRGGTRPLAKSWKRELADKVRNLNIVTDSLGIYRVGVRGHFSSESRPDIQNLFDLISDAVQDGLGVNDKRFVVVDDGYETGYLKPELIITIERI